MKFIRFVFPFLFQRNWVSGSWEISKPRLTLFLMTIGVIVLGILFATVLQAPIEYMATT